MRIFYTLFAAVLLYTAGIACPLSAETRTSCTNGRYSYSAEYTQNGETLFAAIIARKGGAASGDPAVNADAVKACLDGDSAAPAAPGKVFWQRTEDICRNFTAPWRYRANTYEMHYGDSGALARASYALALHARDIDLSLPREKFIKGLLGFHYSVEQICAWLNDLSAGKSPDPDLDEGRLAGILLADGVIAFKKGHFAPAGKIRHVLAASTGKKRSFAATLRHERLHIYWDEDRDFRARLTKKWQALPPEDRKAVKKALSRYAGDNEAQLLEEWAITGTEQTNMDLR
ncbi:MAG: hypothetical protein LBN33_05665 [Desulfovibrio sp.]|jgi:hypothetical protein|nr:hypothetical protein [Desulfovibrio sp.]